MTDVQRYLDSAYRALSGLSISGDAVDVVASIRADLRAAYKLASQEVDTNGRQDDI